MVPFFLSIRMLCVTAFAAGVLATRRSLDTGRNTASFFSRSLNRKSGANSQVLQRQVSSALEVENLPFSGLIIPMPTIDCGNLSNVSVGVAFESVGQAGGIIGVGFNTAFELHPNIIESLQLQGLTNSRAFGLGLGDIHKNEGSVVFGGSDTKKFVGNLATLPLQLVPGFPTMVEQTHYAVIMESIGINIQGQSAMLSSGNTTALLDSGTSFSVLPEDVVLNMAMTLNGTFDYYPNFIVVDCKLRQLNATFDFAFPGLTIHVPFGHFIFPPQEASDTLCLVGATTSRGASIKWDAIILGDTFLQDAYVVFDQTNPQASLAQYVNCGTHEQALLAAASAINQFTREC